MSYTAYPKIGETLPAATPKTRWAVTEKVHGACFCCVYDTATKTFSFGKRRAMLQEGDEFFGYRAALVDDVLPKLERMCEEAAPTAAVVCVYGELFGDGVQTGIEYSTQLRLYVFDILVDREFVDYQELLRLCERHDVLHAAPLAIYSTYGEAISHPLGFNTRLGEKKENNAAEGIVVRPLVGGNKVHERFMVKVKIPEFSERRYSANPKPTPTTSTMWTTYFENEVFAMLTTNRVDAAVSKEGAVTRDRPYLQRLLAEFTGDVMNELRSYDEFCALSQAAQREVTEYATQQCKHYLQKELMTRLGLE